MPPRRRRCIAAGKSLSHEIARKGVTVNAVAPGIIDSPMTRDAFDAQRIEAIVPMRRAGHRDEVAALVAFLASDAAGYVTGAEGALVEALEDGLVSGAALDVTEEEPPAASSPLRRLQNVDLTPHMAGWFDGYYEIAADLVAQNIRRYQQRLPLLNVVSRRVASSSS